MDAPILIDLWTVEHTRRQELLEGISDRLKRVAVAHPGFVSAQIYESIDGGTVLSAIRMRTAKDRQQLTDSREAKVAYRELRAIASTHVNVYRLVESFGEAG